jgi:hypothetical protein
MPAHWRIIMTLRRTALALSAALWSCCASAGDIFGGSAILDDRSHAQLERWLGAGEFHLQNVFTRRPGDTSVEFHRGADGKGATFTLMRLTNALGERFVVGGYNPQSWSSIDGWHVTDRDADRTGFLFNMTVPAVHRQILATHVLPSKGARQTFNAADYGPTFGTGHDLYIGSSLASGFSWQLTYGNPDEEGLSIVDRSLHGNIFTVDALEVLALAPIPEPATWMMLVAGLGLLGGAACRRRARH